MSTPMTPDPQAVHEGKRHSVSHVLAWVSGLVASALTVLFAWIAVSVAMEWSGYVGGESTAALVIVGFVGLLALAAWLVTWALARMRRE
jgi:hypothetical protein